MKLIRQLYNLRPEHRGGVVTIGNFDGIHLGHQAMLGRVQEHAERLGTHTVLMSFDPLPHEFFKPDAGTTRLTNLREKTNALRSLRQCPDHFLVCGFDRALAGLEPEAFIDQILVERLAIRGIVIGDDFRFGKARKGDFAQLVEAGEAHGFEVVALSTHNMDNTRVSSTRVRERLAADDFDAVEKLLGRPYMIEGRVAHGDKLGRTIGFPTANILLHRPATSLEGVYAVKLSTGDSGWLPGVANVGTRPTVDGQQKRLEVHLFDFDQDLYGEHVSVSFHQKIRDEQKFESFERLKAQIPEDCEQARLFHGIST